jgi:hypothetical protein
LTSDTVRPSRTNPGSSRDRPFSRQRALVVYIEGRRGEAALREGAELAATGADLEVVTLAPQAKSLKCCKGNGSGPYNCTMRAVAADELQQARVLLGSLATRATFTTLSGTPEPPVGEWAAARAFDVAIVPGEKLARGGGHLARQLRRVTRAHVRVVK